MHASNSHFTCKNRRRSIYEYKHPAPYCKTSIPATYYTYIVRTTYIYYRGSYAQLVHTKTHKKCQPLPLMLKLSPHFVRLLSFSNTTTSYIWWTTLFGLTHISVPSLTHLYVIDATCPRYLYFDLPLVAWSYTRIKRLTMRGQTHINM